MEIIHMLYVPERSAFLVFYKSPGSVYVSAFVSIACALISMICRVEYDVRQKACILHPQLSDNMWVCDQITPHSRLLTVHILASVLRPLPI